jgi:hypothetical protein
LIASLSTSTFSGKHGSAPLPGEGKNSDLGPIILVIHWAAHASKVNSKVVCGAPSQRCDPSQRCEERLAPKAENGQKKIKHGCFAEMSEASDTPLGNVLDPMERISETLFGLIMALTFICSLGVATGANINIQTMLIRALGCNLAWGIVDGGLYLLARINSRGDKS